MPHMANVQGNVFGGVILSLVDRVAAVAAIRHASGPCVTVAVDRVDFHEPIHVGELVTGKASVNYTGRSSIEVSVEIEAEDIIRGVKRHTNSCLVTLVAVGADGRPRRVSPVLPETHEERQCYEAAKMRYAERKGRLASSA